MSWKKKPLSFDAAAFDNIVEGAKSVYFSKVRPLEQTYLIDIFHHPLLNLADFDARPMVMLIGQYSTGKTSFIRCAGSLGRPASSSRYEASARRASTAPSRHGGRVGGRVAAVRGEAASLRQPRRGRRRYLLQQDFPGMHIGPQPTTDKWQAIMYGPEEKELPGNALASSADAPFFALSRQFGNSFLSRFCGCEVPSEFARGITLIDTPGVLSGKKQTVDRQYCFEDVLSYFAPRVDLILLMFDAHKVDLPTPSPRTPCHSLLPDTPFP